MKKYCSLPIPTNVDGYCENPVNDVMYNDGLCPLHGRERLHYLLTKEKENLSVLLKVVERMADSKYISPPELRVLAREALKTIAR